MAQTAHLTGAQFVSAASAPLEFRDENPEAMEHVDTCQRCADLLADVHNILAETPEKEQHLADLIDRVTRMEEES